MFIRVQKNRVRTADGIEFADLYTSESPIVGIRLFEAGIFFAIRDEIHLHTPKSTKKIAQIDSGISCIDSRKSLLTVGTYNGDIYVLGKSRNILRVYSETNGTILKVFVVSKRKIVACGDDSKIKIYDLSEERSIKTIDTELDGLNNMCVSGNTVYVSNKNIYGFNMDSGEMCFEFTYEHNIINIECYDVSHLVFSSRNRIFVLNTETKQVNTKLCHTKEISRLVVEKNIIYSGSLDGLFKSFTIDLKQVSNIDLHDEITDFSIFNEKPVLVLGENKIFGLKEIENMDKRSVAPLLERKKYKRTKREDIVEVSDLYPKRRNFTQLEKILSQHRYKASVEYAFETKDLDTLYNTFKYLYENHKLNVVLNNASDKLVGDLLEFGISHFASKEMNPIFIEISDSLMIRCKEKILGNPVLFEEFQILSDIIDEELEFQKKLYQAIGFLESYKKPSEA